MNVKDIFIHVGHPKTGSSYIQCALAQSKTILEQHDFQYPIDALRYRKALNNEITAGNFVSPIYNVKKFLQIEPITASKVLLSSESLCHALFNENIYEDLKEVFPKARIYILLFVRDPIEHAISAYQQYIKSEHKVFSIDEFLPGYNPVGNLLTFLETVRKHSDIDLCVFNYSRHRDEVLSCVEQWLNFHHNTLVRPARKRINRSMNLSELALQKAFNLYGYETGPIISNALCEQLPNINHETPRITKSIMDGFCERMQKTIDRLNEFIPKSEHLTLDTSLNASSFKIKNDKNDAYSFSSQQLSVIANSISTELEKLKSELHHETVDKLICKLELYIVKNDIEGLRRCINFTSTVLTQLGETHSLYDILNEKVKDAKLML